MKIILSNMSLAQTKLYITLLYAFKSILVYDNSLIYAYNIVINTISYAYILVNTIVLLLSLLYAYTMLLPQDL